MFGCEANARCFLVQFMCVGLGDVGNHSPMAVQVRVRTSQ